MWLKREMKHKPFIGTYFFTIDPKNRIFIPAKIRDGKKSFIVTSGLDACIYVYTVNAWEELVRKFENLTIKSKKNERAFKRIFLSNAVECEVDGQGRIIIPSILKQQKRITKEVVIIGVGMRIEIWAKKEWIKYYRESEKVFNRLADTLEV